MDAKSTDTARMIEAARERAYNATPAQRQNAVASFHDRMAAAYRSLGDKDNAQRAAKCAANRRKVARDS